VVLDWLRSQKEIDPDRIALRGASLDRTWGRKSRRSTPGCEGPPCRPWLSSRPCTRPLKRRLHRLNYDLCIILVYKTEAELDKFLQSWTLHGVAEKVKCPYLLVGGEDDQLSPSSVAFN